MILRRVPNPEITNRKSSKDGRIGCVRRGRGRRSQVHSGVLYLTQHFGRYRLQ
jgi:hypothetical protein